MNVRRRLILGLTIGIGLSIASAILAVTLISRAHRVGWAGFSYSPPSKKPVTATVKVPGIGEFKPQGVMFVYRGSPAYRLGVKTGDKVISINGADVKDAAALRALDASVRRGDVLTYVIEREGKARRFAIPLESPFRVPIIAAQVGTFTIVSTVFLLTGLLVFSRRPDDRRVVVFYIFTLLVGVSMLGLSGAAVTPETARGIVWDQGFGPSTAALLVLVLVAFASVPLTLHLALIFPKDRPVMQTPRVLGWVYGVPAAVLVACLSLLLAVSTRDLLRASPRTPAANLVAIVCGLALVAAILAVILLLRRAGPGNRRRAVAARPVSMIVLVNVAFLSTGVLLTVAGMRTSAKIVTLAMVALPMLALFLMPVAACISLYRSYREANVEERRQLVWPLWGTIIALGGRILATVLSYAATAYVMATHGDVMSSIGVTQWIDLFTRALYVLIPLSFAFAIFKYRLMNIDIIIRKTVVYALLSGAIIVMYVVLVGGLGTLVLNLTGAKNQTVVIASTLFVALIFVPLRNRLQTLVERNLFRHKYEYPDALRAIAADTLTASELAPFLQSAAEKIQQALQNRAVVVFVQRHDEHIVMAKVGVADTLLGRLRVSNAGMREALDRPFDPRRRALPDDAAAALKRIEAVLVVPINTPGTPPNGFIALGSKLSGGELDVEDIDFLRSAADQLDIGIDRIRQQRDEGDLAQARAIQQTLLPREMPRVAGLDVSGVWLPAREVGGDYYDLLKLGENELAICIGDVAGKGMPAALLMSGLQASVRVTAVESRSPRELCERVRRVIVTSLSGGRFVTFFYAIVDTAAMRIRWCNAGHNAPILARKDGSVVRLEAGGPALSRLLRDQPFTESEIALQPGDRLVLFTDGVSEAQDDSGEMYGEQALETLVAASHAASAHDLQQEIVDAAVRFSIGELEDDVTVVVVKL